MAPDMTADNLGRGTDSTQSSVTMTCIIGLTVVK